MISVLLLASISIYQLTIIGFFSFFASFFFLLLLLLFLLFSPFFYASSSVFNSFDYRSLSSPSWCCVDKKSRDYTHVSNFAGWLFVWYFASYIQSSLSSTTSNQSTHISRTYSYRHTHLPACCNSFLSIKHWRDINWPFLLHTRV